MQLKPLFANSPHFFPASGNNISAHQFWTDIYLSYGSHKSAAPQNCVKKYLRAALTMLEH
jgi:hypothetical protein